MYSTITMSASLKTIATFGIVVLAIYWLYRIFDWVWVSPKKLEHILRAQGFKGNPYRLIWGDQYESEKLIKQAMTKPIHLEDDFRIRTVPHILRAIQTHGKESFMWVGRIPRIFITDPELIREVLTKNNKFYTNHGDLDPLTKFLFSGIGSVNGEIWAKRRKIVKSAFHFEKLKLMLPAFHLSCLDMVNKWEKIVPQGSSVEVDVWDDIKFLTGDVISRTLFGSSFDEGRRIFELINELHPLTIELMRTVYIPGRRYLPTKRNNRLKAIDKEVKGLTMGIIDKKIQAMERGESAGDDLLGTLLESNVEETKRQGKDFGMTIDEIIGECRLFYFAGQDTTSTLIVWTMVLLSRYPEWQDLARNEVFQVFGDKTPAYDGISRLKVVTMILLEVLRVYTPVAELTKLCVEETKLGKYKIPAGVEIMMPQSLLHFDPQYWGDDATEFNPKRFSEGIINATKHQGAYFPFSLGPRMCLGQNFTYLEAKMAFALILRRFKFELSPSYVHAPHTLISMQPQFGAHLILTRI